MSLIFRWVLRLTFLVIVLAVLSVMLVYYLARQSLPDYTKTVAVRGLSMPVEIVRDNANVPHIFGATDADTFFALGYAHAQDRLWQMTVLRRTVQGRLSEVFGLPTVKSDRLMRRLDLHRIAAEAVAAQSDDTKAALQAYSDGVNARLAEINEQALGRGAPEMFLFDAPVSLWRPADSVAILKLLSFQLSGHLEREILRAKVSLALQDPQRAADILPDAPGSGVAALPEYADLFGPLPQFAAAQDTRHPLHPAPRSGRAGASNAWSAAPSRSAAGGALLANDPHLEFSAPAIWYLARLNLSSGAVIGGTIPGIPAILVGRSARLGWGLTSSYLDDQDLYVEKLNPENPQEYLTPQGYAPFDSRPSIIEIKDAPPITLTLRWTENGPVLPGRHLGLETITPPGHVMALAWTALTPDDKSMTAAVDLMRAQDIDAALAATRDFVSPSQNLSVVDSQGGIAMKTIGAVPERDTRHRSQGRFPSQGWREQNRWRGRAPFQSNPEFLRPRGGIIGNTNNKVVTRPFPNHISFFWGDTQRINRWQRLMQSREVHTRDSFIEAQLDRVSFSARSLLPLIGANLWFTGQAAPEGTPERQRQIALSLLAEWNGEMNEHLPEPLIYAAWLRALQDRLIRDELGPLAKEFPHVEPIFIERVYRDIGGASAWCNVKQSAPVETCTDMAQLALDDALIWIAERYGTALESLRWGDAHQATHDHQTLGSVPVLRYFVNIRQSTSGGDNTLLRGRTSGTDPDPFHNVHGAGYRGVYDFADPDSSVFITSTGQSGHFLSRHYDDLAQLWRRGEYIPMSLDENLARAASVGVTRLEPR
jgi:penicillin amidase